MITGINLDETVEYSISTDKENPTIFILGIIPATVIMGLSFNVEVSKNVETMVQVIQLGLKGWKNFDKEFETEKKVIAGREVQTVKRDLVDTFSAQVIVELATKILEVNKLSEQERKN